jgi:hypothetical protein
VLSTNNPCCHGRRFKHSTQTVKAKSSVTGE